MNSIQQLTAGLNTFLTVRTALMKLQDRILLSNEIYYLMFHRYDQISSAVKRNERNVRLEVFLDEIVAISKTDMSLLNTPVLNPICRLLK